MSTGGLDSSGFELADAGPGAVPAGTGPGADSCLIQAMAKVLHSRDDDDFLWALGEFVSGRGGDLLFAAALFALRWRLAERMPWPALFETETVALLLNFRAALVAAGVTAARLPAAALTPAVADTCARLLLTAPAAPPARVLAAAGATG
jgi:hypothetical protein